MRGDGGVALKESSHWSISHSLISHHRTATTDEDRYNKAVYKGWWVVIGVLVWRPALVGARYITLNSLVIISSN